MTYNQESMMEYACDSDNSTGSSSPLLNTPDCDTSEESGETGWVSTDVKTDGSEEWTSSIPTQDEQDWDCRNETPSGRLYRECEEYVSSVPGSGLRASLSNAYLVVRNLELDPLDHSEWGIDFAWGRETVAEARGRVQSTIDETVERLGQNLDCGIDPEAVDRLLATEHTSFSGAVKAIETAGGMLSSMEIMFALANSDKPRSPADTSAVAMEWTGTAENLRRLFGYCWAATRIPGCESLFNDRDAILQRRHANSHCWLRTRGQLDRDEELLNTEEKRRIYFKEEIWADLETYINPLYEQVETLFFELSRDLHVRLLVELCKSKEGDEAVKEIDEPEVERNWEMESHWEPEEDEDDREETPKWLVKWFDDQLRWESFLSSCSSSCSRVSRLFESVLACPPWLS